MVGPILWVDKIDYMALRSKFVINSTFNMCILRHAPGEQAYE